MNDCVRISNLRLEMYDKMKRFSSGVNSEQQVIFRQLIFSKSFQMLTFVQKYHFVAAFV